MRRSAAHAAFLDRRRAAAQPRSGRSRAHLHRPSSQLVVETVTVKTRTASPIEGLHREGFHRHRRRRAAGDQLLRVPEARRDAACRAMAPRRQDARAPRGSPCESDRARSARRHPLPRPPSAGALLRHDRHAASRTSCARSARRRSSSEAQMTAADLVAIMEFTGGAVEVRAGLHRRPRPAAEIVADLIVGEGAGLRRGRRRRQRADTGAAFGQDDASSTSSTPTASWRRCRRRARCSAR